MRNNRKILSCLKGIDATSLKALQHVLQGAVSWCFANNLLMNQDKTTFYVFGHSQMLTTARVPNRFFGIRDFPYLKLGIRDLKAKSGGVSGLKVCPGGGIPKITLGITGLHETLGWYYGIEESYWGPLTTPLISVVDSRR